MVFTRSRQPPFFNLRGIYRISTAPFFQFTWYLQCFLQDLDSPPFSIYMIFTGSREPPFFNLHGIYRVSTAPLFQFTWYLQDLDSPFFQFTWYLQCYLQDLESPSFLMYMIFTGYRQPPFFDLHDIYRISRAPLF